MKLVQWERVDVATVNPGHSMHSHEKVEEENLESLRDELHLGELGDRDVSPLVLSCGMPMGCPSHFRSFEKETHRGEVQSCDHVGWDDLEFLHEGFAHLIDWNGPVHCKSVNHDLRNLGVIAGKVSHV